MSAQTSIRQLDADFEKIQKKLQEGWAKQKHLAEQFTAKLKGGPQEGHIGMIESQRLRVKNIDSAIVASRQPGYFELYESQEKYTKAGIFTDTSRKTPVFVRFSTVAGNKGSADLARDVRGFATKFYTEEGIFDLVGRSKCTSCNLMFESSVIAFDFVIIL